MLPHVSTLLYDILQQVMDSNGELVSGYLGNELSGNDSVCGIIIEAVMDRDLGEDVLVCNK